MSIPPSPYLIVVVPIIIGCVRVAEEHLWDPSLATAGFGVGVASFMVASTFHLILFYVLVQLLLAGALALASGRQAEEMLGPVSVGLVIAWLPPLINLVVPERYRRVFSYFWEFHWDLFARYQAVGESITLWVMIVVSGIFVARLVRSIPRGLLASLLVYGCAQLVGWAWPVLSNVAATIAGSGKSGRGLTGEGHAIMNLSAVLAIFVIYALQRREAWLPSLIRVNHALPAGLVAAVAARLAAEPWHEALLRGLIMAFAAQLLVVANDFLDHDQDSGAGGVARPVGRQDYVVGVYLQALLVFWVVCFRPVGFFALILFFALFTLYHLPPLRLKRLFCGAYRTEGLAAGACFLFGAQGDVRGSWLPIATVLVVGGFSVGVWFKDYKDIPQDRAAGVGTIYTRQMMKGRSLAGIHTFVRCVLSTVLLVPAVWLIAIGSAWLPAVGLVLLAGLIGLFLLGLQDRKLAVESALWALCGYLLLLLAQVPNLNA